MATPERLATLCDELTGRIPEILDEAAALAGGGSSPEHERAPQPGALPAALESLYRWALGCWSDERLRHGAVEAAAEQGRACRAAGRPVEAVLQELRQLGEATRAVLGRDLPAESSLIEEAMARLDRAATVATCAALLGYHAEELAARGEWPVRLHELCSRLDAPADASAGRGG